MNISWRPLPKRSRSLLADSKFRWLFAARVGSTIGDSVAPLAVAFGVLKLTGSATDVGLTLGARVAVTALMSPLAGVIGDRMSRISVILAANSICAVAQSILAITLLAKGGVILCIAAQAVYGIGAALFTPAYGGLVASLVDIDSVQTANSLLAMTFSSASILAPGIGGFAVATFGAGPVVAYDAITFLLSMACISRIAGQLPRRHRQSKSSRPNMRDGWWLVTNTPWLKYGIPINGLIGAIFVAGLTIGGPYTAAKAYGGSASWGLVLAGFGVGALFGSIVTLSRRRRCTLRYAFGYLVLAAPLFLAVGQRAPLAVLVAFAAVAGSAIQIFSTTWTSTIQTMISEEQVSRVLSYDNLGSLSLRPIFYALTGATFAELGIELTWTVGSLLIICLCLCALRIKAIRGLEVPIPCEVPITYDDDNKGEEGVSETRE